MSDQADDEKKARQADDEKKARASQKARDAANSLSGIMLNRVDQDGELYLDEFLKDKPSIIADRRNSILHIMTVFESEDAVTKRELAYCLYWPHFYINE